MASFTLAFVCLQAFLVQNAFSTLIGPGVYGNGFGLGLSSGAGLTAASAQLAGWYGMQSPAKCGEMAYPVREIGAPMWAREGASGPFAAPLAGPFAAPLAGPFGAPIAGPFAAPLADPLAFEAIGAYGGEGVGNVEVAGEMPVAGTTLVAGQVPILGAVRFAGDLPAGGVVTIAGRCGCGCAY